MTFNTRRHTHPRTSKAASAHHRPAELAPLAVSAITGHVERFVGKPALVFHEIESSFVHVDVHWVKPSADHPYHFLFTTGMSARPMCLPYQAPASPYAELAMLLPPTWQLDRASLRELRWRWPIRTLQALARLPHQRGSFVATGTTVDLERYPGTPFTAAVALPSRTLPSEALDIQIGTKLVELLTLWPLHPAELALKLEHCTHALLDALDAADVSDIVDPLRPCAATKFANRPHADCSSERSGI